MEIDNKTIMYWKSLWVYGDNKELGELLGISQPTVTKLFRGTGSEENVKKMNNFYKKRAKDKVKKLKEDIKLLQ